MTNWSKEQLAIFDFVKNGKGHLIVSACPGAGKTTTAVGALESIPEGSTILFMAFSKKIVEELIPRMPKGVQASTCNSFGARVVIRNCRGRAPKLAGGKGEKVKKNLSRFFPRDFPADGYRLADLAKARLAESLEDFKAIVEEFELDSEDMNVDTFVSEVYSALEKASRDFTMIDFADQLWLPIVHNMSVPQYDYVVVDEAQDFSPLMTEFVLKCLRPDGRIIAFGDPLQAISVFRGATLTALEDLGERLEATWLSLPVSYRCAQAIVREAQTISSVIQPADTAIEGKVERISSANMQMLAAPGDFIISRVNAPLVSLVFSFIAQGRRATIQGRDIGDNLANLAKRIGKKKGLASVPEFMLELDSYAEKERAKLLAAKRETDALDDKVACLEVIAQACDEVSEIVPRIESLFSDTDDASRIVLTSAHRSKGLERERCFLLDGTFRVGTKEEDNVKYVAITRAKQELYYVDGYAKKAKAA